MKHYEGRLEDLKNRYNRHLRKLTNQDLEFFSLLKQADLMELKTVLGDINNLLTLKMTIAAANWICYYFHFNDKEKEKVLTKIDGTKPNSKGFDIHITEPYKIIAEVKCNSPVNNGEKFGAAQHDSILNDVHKLIHGKGNTSDTASYIKFLFLIDLEGRTTQAISHLIQTTKGKTATADKYNKLKNESIAILKDETISSLDLNKVYIKTIQVH